MIKSLINDSLQESNSVNRYRIHQGWWREFVLGEQEGRYWDDKNEKWKTARNRINNGVTTGKNFLSDEIAEVVADAVIKQNESRKGKIDEDRLYNNLLSSQPLAFNFFGFFKSNHDIALQFLQTIRPDITKILDVVFEFAPASTKDRSAFDFGFIVRSGEKKGFLGFECKYTDTFSYKNPKTNVYYGDLDDKKNYQNYHQLFIDNQNRFTDDYFSYVQNPMYNQLFRNEILAIQLNEEKELLGEVLKAKYDFIITGLFCRHDDKETVKAGLEFQTKIINGQNDFILLTYAEYFERMQKLELPWEQRELVMLLWARYCGLKLSNLTSNS
jgi:hypothetical protein